MMLLPQYFRLSNTLFLLQSPAPSPFIKEMMDAGQFYTNRVLKDWKDKSKSHVEWTKAWLATLQVRLLGIGSVWSLWCHFSQVGLLIMKVLYDGKRHFKKSDLT